MRYQHVILGGTFDHFHLGHKKLIDRALALGEKVTIGLAKKNLFENKILSQTIEPYSARKKSVRQYLQSYLCDDRLIDIIAISDIFGTTLTDESIDAIIVSRLTYKNALLINKLRKKRGMGEMKIVVVGDVLAEDGRLLTSERIRAGEVDRHGRSYALRVGRKGKKELLLPENMREELRKPLGKVIKPSEFIKFIKFLRFVKLEKIPLIVAVGDIIVMELLKQGINPEVKIIDLRSRREKIQNNHRLLADFRGSKYPWSSVGNRWESYPNKPGTINLNTAFKLKTLIDNAFSRPKPHPGGVESWLVVDGEEDLLALPAVLFAPLGALVLYGQMNLGVVAVEVTETIKEKLHKIIQKFI